MDHIRGKFTMLPFLLALLVAVAGMPTDVVQVKYGEMGLEHTQPWRRGVTASLSRAGRTLMAKLSDMCRGWRGHPLAMSATALVAVAVFFPDQAHGAQLEIVGAVGTVSGASQLKVLRERSATNRRETLARNQVLVNGETLTDEQRTKLTLRDCTGSSGRGEAAPSLLAS